MYRKIDFKTSYCIQLCTYRQTQTKNGMP